MMRAGLVGLGGKLLFAGVLAALIGWQITRAPSPAPARIASAAPAGPKPVVVKPAAPKTVAPVVAAADPFVVKRILDIPTPLHHGEYKWDDTGVPQGPVVITIDLAAEMLSVFRDGYEIGAAVILYGADSKPTPLGVFPILQKDAHHVSNLYGAPMPYAMRLTNDGVFVHASDVAWDAATHGCIGVPKAFAEKMFAQAKVGDRVIITRGKRLDMGGAIAPA